MTKKRYFTISQGQYGSAIFRFENLDGAMEMFKYLMNGKAIELSQIGVPNNKQKPDKDAYVSDEYLHYEKGEPDYHLGSETIEVYTKEEAEKIKKEREEWKEGYKIKRKK